MLKGWGLTWGQRLNLEQSVALAPAAYESLA